MKRIRVDALISRVVGGTAVAIVETVELEVRL